jgi:class 3 adenylate cyclase/hypoxanthine phosphoribosyltransferase
MSSAENAFTSASNAAVIEERACMLISDLCDSTILMWNDLRLGVGLQAAHEALCSHVSITRVDSPQFKSLGDGVMLEILDPVVACRTALELLDQAATHRELAKAGKAKKAFENLHLKITVSAGDFRRARGTQKWLGLLPTKASRIANYARKDEIWIDNEVAASIHPSLGELNAEFDQDPGKGAAFYVPLKGLAGQRVSIHQLRKAGTKPALAKDELEKTWLIPWSDAMVGLKCIVESVEKSRFGPRRVVGIGRSGAILGGIIAGNLNDPRGQGHLPVDVCERRHLGDKGNPRRAISTLTEPEEVFTGDHCVTPQVSPTQAWDAGPVLLVIGEAKTQLSFESVKAWLARRGITEVQTAALLKSKAAHADHYWLEAENAWLPWQFKPGYDLKWPTYRDTEAPVHRDA